MYIDCCFHVNNACFNYTTNCGNVIDQRWVVFITFEELLVLILKPMCENCFNYYFLKSNGITRIVSSINFFPRKKESNSQAWQFSTIWEQPVFLANSHKSDFKKFKKKNWNYFLDFFFDKIINFEYIFNNL